MATSLAWQITWKSAQRDENTARGLIYKAEPQKKSRRRKPPSRGHRMAKI